MLVRPPEFQVDRSRCSSSLAGRRNGRCGKFAREIRDGRASGARRAERSMVSTLSPGFRKREIDRHVAARTRVRSHVGVLDTKSPLARSMANRSTHISCTRIRRSSGGPDNLRRKLLVNTDPAASSTAWPDEVLGGNRSSRRLAVHFRCIGDIGIDLTQAAAMGGDGAAHDQSSRSGRARSSRDADRDGRLRRSVVRNAHTISMARSAGVVRPRLGGPVGWYGPRGWPVAGWLWPVLGYWSGLFLINENDEQTLQALAELNDNPLGASLNIKAKEPSQYEGIAGYLKGKDVLLKDGASIVDKINYYQNKVAIDRFTKIIDGANKVGMGLIIILVLFSIIITFNTIRLTIYVSRDEISVMKLVGASNRYIRGPFVVSGIMYGFVSAMFTLIMFYPITFYSTRATENFFMGLNLFDYYIRNFGQIFLIIAGSGIFIGAISSYLAVRRYLKV